MLIHRTLTPLAVAAMAVGVLASNPAAAQQAAPEQAVPQQAAPSSGDAAQPASATTSAMGDPSAPLGSAANPIKQSSPTPVDQAYQLKAGDPTVISNPPVPDTPQNRAQYGRPLSNGGAHTAATGD
jgi:hypothetical protein